MRPGNRVSVPFITKLISHAQDYLYYQWLRHERAWHAVDEYLASHRGDRSAQIVSASLKSETDRLIDRWRINHAHHIG